MKKLFKSLLVAGMLFGGLGTVNASTNTLTQVSDEYVTIGAQANYQETLNLLGANHIPKENQLLVDGNMIGKYLEDGTDNSSNVYSSAKISPQGKNEGVTVEVVTPKNILNVTPETYANAAITAGMSDVKITVASAQAVTGEGALTGIYAVQDALGKLNTYNVSIAQDELSLITNVSNGDAEKNALMNAAVAEIKAEIAQKKQNGEDLNEQEINQIVTTVTNNYNITLDGNQVNVATDVFGRFAESDIAKDEEFNKQLNTFSKALANKGSEFFEGLNTKMNDPEFQREANNFMEKAWNGFVNFLGKFISILLEFVMQLVNGLLELFK